MFVAKHRTGSYIRLIWIRYPVCLIKHNVMKSYRRMEVRLHTISISALYGREWLDSFPGHFTSPGQIPVPTGYEAEWAPDQEWKLWTIAKSLALVRNRNLTPLPSSLCPSHYTDWATPTLTLHTVTQINQFNGRLFTCAHTWYIPRGKCSKKDFLLPFQRKLH